MIYIELGVKQNINNRIRRRAKGNHMSRLTNVLMVTLIAMLVLPLESMDEKEKRFRKHFAEYFKLDQLNRRVALIGSCDNDALVIFNDFYVHYDTMNNNREDSGQIVLIMENVKRVERKLWHPFCAVAVEDCHTIGYSLAIIKDKFGCFVIIHRPERIKMLHLSNLTEYNS